MHARQVKLECYNCFVEASIKGDMGEGENELIKKINTMFKTSSDFQF